jgi:Flp pilus assembly pilin Flp
VFSNIVRLARQGDRERESGQALVEYALILMLIALVAVGALTQIGVNIVGPLSDAAAGVGGG